MEDQKSILDDRNLVDDLVSYFRSKPEVAAAYFGFLHNPADNKPHLFLAVEHNGELENIKKVTYLIKQIYLMDQPLNFVSTEERDDLLDLVKSFSFAFYSRDEQNMVNMKIMKQWFDERYKQELADAVMKEKIFTLVKSIDTGSATIAFQNYMINNREFIPLFSEPAMLAKSGMEEIPEGLELIGIYLDKVFGDKLNGKFFILNPGTQFAAELTI